MNKNERNEKQDELPPVQTNKRYSTSIPQGRMSHMSPSQVPVISRKGSIRKDQINSSRQLTDPSVIDKKLKSLSQNYQSDFRISLESDRKEKANLKFLKYKFNPNDGDQSDNLDRENSEAYGQLSAGKKQKISINTFYQHKNVLFQDQRAPLVYKKLFLAQNP